ncbi:MAG: hypothetical protein WHS82_07705 [Candidatus Methanosuratincola sp.]
MGDEVVELLLVVPVILAVVAINAFVVGYIGDQTDALEEVTEALGRIPFEYVFDNASGNAYPEAFCGG